MTIKQLRELDEKSILSDEQLALLKTIANQLPKEKIVQLINFIGVSSGKIGSNQVS